MLKYNLGSVHETRSVNLSNTSKYCLIVRKYTGEGFVSLERRFAKSLVNRSNKVIKGNFTLRYQILYFGFSFSKIICQSFSSINTPDRHLLELHSIDTAVRCHGCEQVSHIAVFNVSHGSCVTDSLQNVFHVVTEFDT